MFCVKCGAENPDDAAYCHKCGARSFSSLKTETAKSIETPAPQSGPPKTLSEYKWATVYGWTLILAGLLFMVAGFISLTARRDMTLPPTAFGNAEPIGIAPSLAQGLLFTAAGLAIIRRKKIAVTLVWVVTVLAGLGTLFRGFTPVDLALWLLQLWLATWYAKKKSFLTP